MAPNAEQNRLIDEFAKKLARLRVDDLILVVSLSLSWHIDKTTETLTEYGKCLQKKTMIEKIIGLVPVDLVCDLSLMVDYLSAVSLTKTWMVYALRRDVAVAAAETAVNVDELGERIERVFANEKITVTVHVLEFLGRFFIQMDYKEKKQQYQYYRKTGELWVRSPVNKQHLQLMMKSLEYESIVFVRDEHKDDYGLMKLWLEFCKVPETGETEPELGAASDRTPDSNGGSCVTDIEFVEKMMPRTKSLTINVKNAGLGSAFEFPELRSEIEDDERFELRLVLESDNVKEKVKSGLERDDFFVGNRLPDYLREHFASSNSNEVSYQVPDLSDSDSDADADAEAEAVENDEHSE